MRPRSHLRYSVERFCYYRSICILDPDHLIVFETSTMPRVIADYFRSPGPFPDFELMGTLCAKPGYFCLGSDAICYRRSAAVPPSRRPIGSLHDVLHYSTAGGGIVRLPVDPNEIIENLRFERYQRDEAQGRTRLAEHPTLRDIYYRLRHLFPVAFRRYLQKIAMRDWHTIAFPNWPVDDTVERILERLLALSMKAQGVDTIPFIWFWPDAATSCVIMTHDVEGVEGRDFCSRLMDLDDAAGIKASFQVVPQKRYAVPN